MLEYSAMFKPIEENVNFPEMEKKWLTHWYSKGLVKKYLQKNNKSKKTFSFLDGPITANNPMGVHHAWGRTYKDLWPKFYNLLGYKQRFQNGFDCQGLWVEVEVEKELGLRGKKEIENLISGNREASIAKFVNLCKERVYKYSKIQTEQTKRLGYFADWDNSYYTMSDENNYMIWHFLKTANENGWIYKGRESVPWCPRCETAISEHEILTEDYKVVGHESVILEFPIKHLEKKKHQKEFLLVWTTTPWTIPANIAVAVDPKANYSLVQGKVSKDSSFWVMKDLIDTVFTKGYKKILKTVTGKELVGLRYTTPFDDLPGAKEVAKKNPEKFHLIVPTDTLIMPISSEEGTGLVHTAVSAGTEDFKLGRKLGLPMIPVIGDNADYLPGLGFLSGKNAKKNPRIILDYLEEQDKKGNDCVFSIFNYKHRYPACWRCKAELVWKVEDEWYISMDKPSLHASVGKSKSKTLRQRMIEVAKKIKWMPDFGLDRELDWLKNMHDWLISKKNRYWGLALPIYECKKCGNFEVIGSKQELKEKAVKGWELFDGHTPHKPFIDEVQIKCSKCQSIISRINDVGNPWLDAGIVPYSTITEHNQGEPLYLKNKEEWKKWFPADFITESFPGQFKNWFYALIAESTVLEGINPFKTVLGFGTQLGEDGRPMHKSWGNAIEFNEGADKIGVDVMRWMFSRQNPADNMLFGYKKADEVRRQFYLLLWNVYKFFTEYANLDEFKTQGETLSIAKRNSSLNVLDKWVLSRLTQLINILEEKLKAYNAKDAALETEKFINDLSTWYIRRSRDRIWTNSDDKEDKYNFYKTLHYILVNLSVVLSPFMPFITEEIYTNLTGGESVHLTIWPMFDQSLLSESLNEKMDFARKIVEVGHGKRKELKFKIRQPLMSVEIESANDTLKNTEFENLIKKELNVKNLSWKKANTEEIKVSYDTKMTKELEIEGKLRDLIRQIQQMRKQLGIKPDQKVNITIPSDFKEYKVWIGKRVLAKSIEFGQVIKVDR